MEIPTKEELAHERDCHGLTEECPDFRFGGEAEGFMEFAQSITAFGLSQADETFLNFLIWSSYPYNLADLVDSWDENVMRDGTVARVVDGEVKYFEKYSSKQKEAMALAWFDRRLGKLIRIGALNCSMNTKYFNALKEGFRLKNLIEIIQQKQLKPKD